MTTKELHEWKCPYKGCKKVIRSLYERQFDQQRNAHVESHENAKEKSK